MSEPAPAPVNSPGTADIAMYPDQTFRAAQQIYQAGASFGQTWPGRRTAIQGDEQAVNVGFDEVSREFRGAYNKYAEAVLPWAEQVMPGLQDAGNAGNESVARYLELSNQQQPAYMRTLL
ncbi:hypothetical protein [Kribbella sindirgiensis]|uniref:Uncharacterized protein n=1 Tax=Kribbella sindirgiensis TaxID=1124744 RepID=A0A4R0I6Z4_9ACTN|nr:hypothetical protein [Kribbella sindirgiensis]TCC22330.1 hypothetical protein E0H50_34700 [Kribbella sindirgiensis]